MPGHRHLLDEHARQPAAVGRLSSRCRQQSTHPRRAAPAGHVILDMAMSQFSYGALTGYQLKGQLLPVDGGFDSSGNLTRDPPPSRPHSVRSPSATGKAPASP